MEDARRRLTALEERVPWNAVKKTWATRRGEWVVTVGNSAVCAELAHQLLVLESNLKTDSLSASWPLQKVTWKTRMSACHEPRELIAAVGELEKAVQWQRILIAPDGRPLSAAEISSGQFGVGGTPSVPVPPPLSDTLAANGGAPINPPDGVPRAASRMLLLLQDMGARHYDPKVVVQLLDVMYGWTAAVLLDASTNARMRVLPSAPQLAYGTEPPIESEDVALAVRSRVEHGFTRVAAREVLAQQAAATNAEPMPILPRRTVVALPSDPSQCVPGARRLIEHGLDVDDADEEGAGVGLNAQPAHSWWHLQNAAARAPAPLAEEDVSEPAAKRAKH